MARPPKTQSRSVAWDFSCPDWQDRLKSGRSLVPDLPLTPDGERAVKILDRLKLADVPGTPTFGEAGGDWFRDIVRALFGSMVNGQRMIREPFLLVPKKNSKTTNGSLMMVTAFLMNERPNARFILTAPVQDVAELAFAAAAGAIMLDPVLKARFHIRDHLKTIIDLQHKSELQIMTFDPSVLTGQKCAGVLIDELHVIAKMNKAASAIRQLRGGMLPYPEAFMAFITTQSEEAPSGVFKAELDKAREIRDGKRKGAMLPVLYEFPPEMQKDPQQWRDAANWKMVTPNAGRSVQIPRLVEEYETAQATGEEELRAWASQHLNVEIGLALMSNGWAGAHFWPTCAESLPLDEVLRRSEVATIGIDGGGLDDMLGLAVIGREAGTGKWLHWAHAWVHPIVLERRKSEASRFRDFERDGDLTIVEKIGDDVEEVADYASRVDGSHLLDRVGVDNAGIGAIVDGMVDRGIDHDRIVGISQGWRLNGAIKTVERKLAEGTMRHGGSALMNWCAANARVEPRGNAILITKQAAGTAKIDPLMATFNAASLMAMDPQPRKKNYQIHFF